jgi:hypothetical protein
LATFSWSWSGDPRFGPSGLGGSQFREIPGPGARSGQIPGPGGPIGTNPVGVG